MGPEAIRAEGRTQEELHSKIAATVAKIKEAGYEIDGVQVAPEEIATLPATAKDKLLSRKWDGFIIGFGIRGVPEYTDVFENL